MKKVKSMHNNIIGISIVILCLSGKVYSDDNLYQKAREQYNKGEWLIASQSLYAYYYYEAFTKGQAFNYEVWNAYKYAHDRASGREIEFRTQGMSLAPQRRSKPQLRRNPPR